MMKRPKMITKIHAVSDTAATAFAEFEGHLDTYGKLRLGDSMTLEFTVPNPGVSRSNISLQAEVHTSRRPAGGR